ncbi:xyloglucanase [Paenibacillus sp. YAF4_2]|uniref:WD40/YVTN/BNR-like repeat-containing protein n=1 Tax=Paenibacillus sp. YAF4_2 TaxID=3233085 RepID=UPI003F9A24A9
MRKKVVGLIAIIALVISLGGNAVMASSGVKTQSYDWGRVETVGGGFIPGIIYNPSEKDLVYVRTDMGGAYRWNKQTNSWKQLLDWVGFDEWNMAGVESLATDPVDPNRVYIAAGTYSNDFTDQNGVMLRSTDKGETWKKTVLPFKFGGNMPGRSMGERLVIDPNNNSVLYFGARNGNGLWRSTDYGATWRKVTSFTAGQNVKDYYGGQVGPVWVAFDPSTGKKADKKNKKNAQTTQTIYVGVADTEKSIYKSTDGGVTWAPVEGQPNEGFVPHHGVLASDGKLYITYNSAIGPYDGPAWNGTKAGSVWKYDTVSGGWTNISPAVIAPADANAVPSYPFGGLAVDPSNPNTIMVATMNMWWPDEHIFRSTDGGATWTSMWTMGEGWSRVNKYDLDYSKAPWLDWGKPFNPTDVEQNPKMGWMIGDLEIDPFNSDRLLYGTGATLFAADKLMALDRDNGDKVKLSVNAQGIEETAVLGLISPPEGAHLISSMGDIGGFRHEDLDTAPTMITNPYIGTSTDLDYAELNPNLIVRVGNAENKDARMGVSADNGVTWTPAANAWTDVDGDKTQGGTVAVGADGNTIVWAPKSASAEISRPVSYSTNNGQTWSVSAGVPEGAMVSSDRVNPSKFYAYANSAFYVSTDGGATFVKSAKAVGLPSKVNSKFKAVPGVEGDIWLVAAKDNTNTESAYGVFHSTDSGATFTKLKNVQEAAMIGFGKAAPGKSYMVIYMNGRINGKFGFYRSDDAGRSWIRINDDLHQYANATQAITGDPRVFGRVYIGTNGFGIVRGDIADGSHKLEHGDPKGNK